MKQLLVTVIVFLFFLNFAVGQTRPFDNPYGNPSLKKIVDESNNQFNVLKINPLKLAFGDLNLSYERVLSQNRSVNVRLQYHPLGFVERWFDDWVGTGDDYTFALAERPAFHFAGVDAEYRFYFNKDKVAQGFYLAPYARYTNSGARFKTNYNTTENSSGEDLNVTLSAAFNTVGVGVQTGMHWLINDRISIDWGFAGLGADLQIFSTKLKSDNLGANIEQYTLDLQKVVSTENSYLSKKFFIDIVDVNRTYTQSYFLAGWKSSLTVGIAF